jgi:hypothetical protein
MSACSDGGSVYKQIKTERTTIAHVLQSKLSHDLGQKLNVGAQHVQGRVDHLNKIGSVHDETLTRKKFRRSGINIDRESKKDLGLRTLLEKPG